MNPWFRRFLALTKHNEIQRSFDVERWLEKQDLKATKLAPYLLKSNLDVKLRLTFGNGSGILVNTCYVLVDANLQSRWARLFGTGLFPALLVEKWSGTSANLVSPATQQILLHKWSCCQSIRVHPKHPKEIVRETSEENSKGAVSGVEALASGLLALAPTPCPIPVRRLTAASLVLHDPCICKGCCVSVFFHANTE